mgnify:FL=1
MRGEERDDTPGKPGVWKYLRMRGEEPSMVGLGNLWVEIPPHARRRDTTGGIPSPFLGNTSACSEKSCGQVASTPLAGKYLRMRGEKTRTITGWTYWTEIPPHARRRAILRKPGRIIHRKYLRMRGEEPLRTFDPILKKEIPPHARRRGFMAARVRSNSGNTSACAEKSLSAWPAASQYGKYLRMRGEELGFPLFL